MVHSLRDPDKLLTLCKTGMPQLEMRTTGTGQQWYRASPASLHLFTVDWGGDA